MKTSSLNGLIISLLFLINATGISQVPEISNINWRCVGPVHIGGRVTTVAGVPGNHKTFYIGTAAGGLYRTLNGGTTFESVFDDNGSQSIGAMAIDLSNPEIIYVGTGEGDPRNDISYGDGIYRSDDGGETWNHLGLSNSERFSAIAINPDNPQIVYAAAMGTAWAPNEERGLFRSTNGGDTWEKILYVNSTTGASSVCINPENPNIIYAGMYDYLRQPWHFRSGGPGSGLYRSLDSGDTWELITDPNLNNGLPGEKVLGRVDVDISHSNTQVIYTMIESQEEGELWRSDDGGNVWQMINSDTRINNRPFYYNTIFISPDNELNVWALAGSLNYSVDGGQNFQRNRGSTFGDHHALWIDPEDPDYIINGCDGGVSVSFDRGRNWDYINNMPMIQAYHVGFDMKIPYNLYAGFQDHEIWRGPSQRWASTGATGADWTRLRDMADGMYAFAHPADDNIIIYNGHFGDITRLDLKTGQERFIQPHPIGPSGTGAGYEKFRFHWDSPILISPHDSELMYYGGNVLFRSPDRGETWDIISPDLTSNDPAKMKVSGGPISPDNTRAEYHCTIISIAESPVIKGRLIVGTDDGKLHVSDNDGETWTNLTAYLPGPDNAWISEIVASRFNADRIYISIDHHRTGDFNSYVYKSDDLGITWEKINAGLKSYVHCVKEDLENPKLLFAGTERGIYASFNGGELWNCLNINMPDLPVRDIQIHPRESDLILATHGRGLFILDDIAWMRELSEVNTSKPSLFSIRDTYRYIPVSDRSTQGNKIYIAPNPSYGAIISYSVPEEYKAGNLVLRISNSNGQRLWEMEVSSNSGIHRTSWNLGEDLSLIDETIINDRYAGLLKVPPGKYLISLKDKQTILDEKYINVIQDPRLNIENGQTEVCYEYIHKLGITMNHLRTTIEKIESVREYINNKGNESETEKIISKIDDINYKIVPERMSPNGMNLLPRMNWLFNQVRKNSWEPTLAQKEWIDKLINESDKVLVEWEDLLRGIEYK